jgi:acetyl-CoA carboxylase carboxyltransferase component
MPHVPHVPLGSPREAAADARTFAATRGSLAALEARFAGLRAEIEAGWGAKYRERVHAKGKLTARERLERLLDPGTRPFEVGTFVNEGERFGELTSPAAGVVTAIMEGSANAFSDVKKIQIVRAQWAPVDIILLLRSRSRGEVWGDPTG